MFINPNLDSILKDFELWPKTTEQWAELRVAVSKLPHCRWNTWNTWFSFSFVTPELIFDHKSNTFATEVEGYSALEPIGISRDCQLVIKQKENAEGVIEGPVSPCLNLKPRGNGYALSIEMRDDYWSKIRTKETFSGVSDEDVKIDPMCGTAEVRLALLPYEEFAVHAQTDSIFDPKARREIVESRTQARRRNGWVGHSHSDIYGFETSPEDSDSIEHKYFNVSHWAL